MFEEAQARAEYLDNLRAQGKSAGPLHGLPVSIKDNFQYKGREATIGMVTFMDEVASANSALVDILLNLGAVIYVKTNVPQTMMVRDSNHCTWYSGTDFSCRLLRPITMFSGVH